MSAPTIPVSAYIICKDERDFLGPCLESLSGFQEIVVVDSGSTDGTLELLADFRRRGLPIRLFERDWPGFAKQKQFALDRCTLPWCLNLDADERLEPDLAAAIGEAVRFPDSAAGFTLRMAQYLPGYGYAPPIVHVKPQLRLVERKRARYDTTLLLHEGLQVDGPVKPITRGRVLHYRNLSLGADLTRASRYATLKARQYHARGRRGGAAAMFMKPFARFLKSYLLQRYFVCGTAGLIYSAMLGIYVFLAEAKLWRLSQGEAVPEED
jgi:glycosyltransferase involved in cell wall biosynthesis